MEILQHHSENLQGFLDYALDKALELTQSEIGYIYFYNEDRKEFYLNSWSKDVMKECSVVYPQSCYELDKTGIWGEAVRQRKPILINDYKAQHPLKKGYPEGHVCLTSFLTVPIFHNQRIVAVVGVANKSSDYNETDTLELTLLMDAVWKSVETMRVEEELRRSEAKFRVAFQTTPDSININRMSDNLYKEVNDGFLRIMGYSREEALGRSSIELNIWADDVDRKRLLDGLQKNGFVENMETRFCRKDGTLRDGLMSARMIDLDGEPCILSITRDITEYKKTEEDLRKQENLMQRTFDILPIGLWFADKDGRLLRGNPMGVKIWGAEPHVAISEYGNLKAWRLPSGEPLAADDWALLKTVRDGVTIVDELLEIESFDGKRKTILNYSAPVLDSEGNIDAAIVVNLDISEYKNLEDQLRHAQKIESVGRLAGGVAHDFNNMLGVILGHTELALNQTDPEHPFHDSLEEIRKAAKRSADLTRQLLAYARKQTFVPKVLDLNETVVGMLKMLKRLIGEDIDLKWRPETNLWPIKLDPSQLDQILANLCVNARDAITDTGKVTIETGMVEFDDIYCAEHVDYIPGEYVMLAISDNGCGMDRETLGKLFEPFFTTKIMGKGTGLGLATVYGIVKQNNGLINVYSEPDQGTTFKIYLPRHKGKIERVKKESLPELAVSGHETILLVEDELAILQMTIKMLESKGYTVLAASTPGEAMRLAEIYTGRIELLITDVVMPEMNGRDLARNLLSLYPDLKRLFMSGYTANVIAHHGVLDPGVHFIQKPFSMSELTAKIRDVLDHA